MEAGSKAIDLLRNSKVDGDAVRKEVTAMNALLASATKALRSCEEEIGDLKKKLADQSRIEAIRADMIPEPDGGFMVRQSEMDAGRPVPYCPVCWYERDKTIPLNEVETAGLFKCTIDQSLYKTEEYREKRRRSLASSYRSGPALPEI
jgi:hypothetical protein